MHHSTDRIIHTTAFVTPVVEHWLEREIAQWVTWPGVGTKMRTQYLQAHWPMTLRDRAGYKNVWPITDLVLCLTYHWPWAVFDHCLIACLYFVFVLRSVDQPFLYLLIPSLGAHVSCPDFCKSLCTYLWLYTVCVCVCVWSPGLQDNIKQHRGDQSKGFDY